MKARRWAATVLIAGSLLASGFLLNGCKKQAPASEAAFTDQGSAAPATPHPAASLVPIGSGVVTGTVTFAGKPPAKIKIDTSMDPACDMSSPGPVYTEQYVVDNGKLANVFVYVKSGPPAAMQMGESQTQPVVLDQKGCQYIPHVIGVVQGGAVQFENSDATMHNIHTMPTDVGNQPIDISQSPRGAPVIKRFAKPEVMIPVRCNNHPWMNAFINVSATPFFAVTGTDGHFRISGLPPGNYVVGAVQEKLGEQDVNVTVPPTGTAKADFSFSIK
jgi:plastocyanin